MMRAHRRRPLGVRVRRLLHAHSVSHVESQDPLMAAIATTANASLTSNRSTMETSHCSESSSLPNSEDRCCGKPARLLGETGVAKHPRQGNMPAFFRVGEFHHDKRRCAVGNGAGVRRGNGTVFLESRFQIWNFLNIGSEGLFISINRHCLFARIDGNG